MDFAFSEEQEMLRSQARSFLTEQFSPERVAEIADAEEPWSDELAAGWKQIAELGWTGLSVSEEHGGAGMTFLDEAVVLEELGYALFPAPYFSTIALALPALDERPDLQERVASGEARVALAWAEEGIRSFRDLDSTRTRAHGSGDDWSLTGTKDLVGDLGAVNVVLVVANTDAGLGIWALEREGAGEIISTMDSTRRLGRLSLQSEAASVVVEPGRAAEVLERVRLRALSALALEATGIAQSVLDKSIAHTKERQQFDKPIGAYQAVSHAVADTYVDAELARSIAYWAAWCVAEGDAQAPVAAAAAKAFAGEAAVRACERSIQVHGGIGFTGEHPLHRYYKRAQWIDSFDGYGSSPRASVAAALLDS